MTWAQAFCRGSQPGLPMMSNRYETKTSTIWLTLLSLQRFLATLPKSWGSSIAPVTKRSGIQWGRVGLAATSMALAIRWKRVLQAGSYSNPKNIAFLPPNETTTSHQVNCPLLTTAHQQCIHLVHDKVSKQDYFHLLHTCGSQLIPDNTCIRFDGNIAGNQAFYLPNVAVSAKVSPAKNGNHFNKTQQLWNYGTQNHNLLRTAGTMELPCNLDPTGPHLQGLQQDIPILWKQFHASTTGAQFHQEMDDKKGKTWQYNGISGLLLEYTRDILGDCRKNWILICCDTVSEPPPVSTWFFPISCWSEWMARKICEEPLSLPLALGVACIFFHHPKTSNGLITTNPELNTKV